MNKWITQYLLKFPWKILDDVIKIIMIQGFTTRNQAIIKHWVQGVINIFCSFMLSFNLVIAFKNTLITTRVQRSLAVAKQLGALVGFCLETTHKEHRYFESKWFSLLNYSIQVFAIRDRNISYRLFRHDIIVRTLQNIPNS